MGLNVTEAPGSTPLDPDETAALVPRHISTQGQLNEWEHQNIVEGQQWALSRNRKDLLSIEYMKELHKKMFGNTWLWAGSLRVTEKNIGVAPETISVRLRELCDDVQAQLQYKSYTIREIAARFHHRLVFVHPFPNGNGRFARLMTDLLLLGNGEQPFSWGDGDLVTPGEVRRRYIEALRAADAQNHQPLLAFLQVSADAPTASPD